MRHGPARRRLAQLLDGTLSDASDRAVREHAAGCRRCARHLAELERCERLLAGLPFGVLPSLARTSERRLERLARWAEPRRAPERLAGLEGLAMATAAATLVTVVALSGLRPWMPDPEPGAAALTQVAYVMPATSLR